MTEEEKMRYQLWDNLFKIVGDRFPDELVQFVYPDNALLIDGKKSSELSKEQRQEITTIWQEKREQKLLARLIEQAKAMKAEGYEWHIVAVYRQ